MIGLKRTVAGAVFLIGPAVGYSQQLDLVVDGSDELKDELRAALSVDALLQGETPTPQSLLAAAQADYARLLAVLYDGGRFAPEVSIRIDGREAADISPFEAPSAIRTITVTVDPNGRFTFGQAEIGPLAEGTQIPETFRPGERAGTAPVRAAAKAAVDGWRDVGHAKAEIASQQIRADHRNRELDVTLRVAPGPQLRFGEIVVSGNDRVRRTRIREIAGIPEGAVFDPDEIVDAERRLRRTGVFSSAAISEADRANPDGTLDLALQVAEQKPRRFGFGAEVSTQDGGKVSAFWLHRNLFQGAERLRVDGEISGISSNGNEIDYKLKLTYGRPATFTPDTEFFLTAELEHLDEPGFVSDQAGVAAGLSHRFSDQLEASFSLGYRYIDTTDAFGTRQFSLVTTSLSATYDTRTDTLNPTNGYFLTATGTPFLGLNGTKSGFRLTSDARAYVGLGVEDRYVLAGRAQIGSVWGPSLMETVPDYLFYSGGGGTVRGQDYQSLGVTTPMGEFTGGQSFAALSAELRANVTKNIGLVGFYDVGMVTEDSGFAGDSDWHAGAGVGLRYNTGIGPIRLDIATPASGSEAGQSVQFYIGIGQAF